MSIQLDSDGTGSPIASAIAHWRLLVAGTALGALVGGAAGFLIPTTYSAEARLAVGAGNSSAYAIAGYPTAARELAQNYSRWVQNNAADGTWSHPGVSNVAVTPIPDSGVIRIETKAADSPTAVQGAAHIADQLLATVGDVEKSQNAEAALAEYRKLTPAVATAQAEASMAESTFGRTPTPTNARAVAAARSKLSETILIRDAAGDRYRRLAADPSSVSQLTTISHAAETGDDGAANVGVGVGAGAGLGLLVAFVTGALNDARRGRRRAGLSARSTDEVATDTAPADRRADDVVAPSGAGKRRDHSESSESSDGAPAGAVPSERSR